MAYLTLTRVVFEYNKKFVGTELNYNLTLTRVVFEFYYSLTFRLSISNLTLTRVVFEFTFMPYPGRSNGTFNFNKSCI